MDVPMDAKVELLDGEGGHTTRVLLNPISKKITHLIVREPGLLGIEREVPMELMLEGTPKTVRLRLTRDELAGLPPLEETRYITPPEPLPPYPQEALLAWPYYPVDGVAITEVSIPPGELAVRRGQRVQAADGRVGRVDEFLVDPVSERITHLRMREGHLWGQREVTIPVDQIDRIEEDAVHLKLNKRQVEELPTMPVRA
jgi:sporulation protein YlmC with PRC-barrel domain